METIVIKVSGTTNVNKAAGAIANSIRDGKKVEVMAIGPTANNQVVKALATARGFIASNGLDLTFAVAFSNTTIEDAERTAMKYVVLVNQIQA